MPTSLFVAARTILLRGVTATGALTGRHHQMSATSLRWASVSPSMYRWVVWIERWPANNRTSRKDPPVLWRRRAALVTNVRRPECDEQPLRPMLVKALLNHTTTLNDRIGPPRVDAITCSARGATSRQSASATASSGCSGIERPLHFFAQRSGSSIRPLIRPAASVTMVHVKFAISPARRPALADNSTSTRFLSGFRVQQANTSKSCRLSGERIFA
jgi:hypothetical protein